MWRIVYRYYVNAELFPSFYQQFREAVKDCTPPHSDDVYLLRWLIGNYMNE